MLIYFVHSVDGTGDIHFRLLQIMWITLKTSASKKLEETNPKLARSGDRGSQSASKMDILPETHVTSPWEGQQYNTLHRSAVTNTNEHPFRASQ